MANRPNVAHLTSGYSMPEITGLKSKKKKKKNNLKKFHLIA